MLHRNVSLGSRAEASYTTTDRAKKDRKCQLTEDKQ